MKKAPCIAILGTGSEVGKSVVATALCRLFVNRGINVAPYKAQNMSNNSGVTPVGLEMGRAQIVQAEAAKIPPHVDMNPILLKPTSDDGSQIVLFGKAVANSTAGEYRKKNNVLFSKACDALDRLREAYDLIVMEGAGSCAEVNLMARDIVNLRMAEYADAPVVLVSDIHRGGVFAQIIGTLACLSNKHQKMVKGFIVNRFRGDINLFKDGVRWIEDKTGKKVFGVVPWYDHIHIEAEDSVVIENPAAVSMVKSHVPTIAVIRLPHISNFTDFDPLSNLKGLDVYFIEKPRDLTDFKAVILPGSKNTRWDLRWLKKTGWADIIKKYTDADGHVLGICGGYQIMGHFVHDPQGLEGAPGTSKGLNLLPIETVLKAPKTTTRTRFLWKDIEGMGYEIHMGETRRLSGDPLFSIFERNLEPCKTEDGCKMHDSRLIGTYIHGMFDTPEITQNWLKTINLAHINVPDTNYLEDKDKAYDLLAAHFEHHIDTEEIVDMLSVATS
jgi:adenosylcobyric acid synthase